MINLRVSPDTLCTMLNGEFTLEACQAIDEFLEENSDEALTPMDIRISFFEVPRKYSDDFNPDQLIAELNNGNNLYLE